MSQVTPRICAGLFILLGLAATFVRAADDAPAADPYAKLKYYYPVPKADPAQTIEADVIVYEGTPAGITAAIQATRMGKTAVLIEFGRHIGGMTASGLSATDGGGTAGGIARKDFYSAVGNKGFKPAAAEAQYKKMLETAGVRVFYEHRLATVTKDGTSITSIAMENGSVFKGKMFIDATYEGDLLAKAGVSFHVGREANAQYGETINGVSKPGSHNFSRAVDPYVKPGDPKSGVLFGITNTSPDAPGVFGSADKRVQAYNFRMFLAKMPDAIPFPKPPGYEADKYELLLRYILSNKGPVKYGDFMQLKLGDSNNNGGFSTDFIGASDRWPEGSYEEREKIYQAHVTYQQGFMYFLANDPRVPEQIRKDVSALGLGQGNFPETGGWPHQLYVREGRRMVGEMVMTEHHCRHQETAEDSIGLAEYTMDSHNCQRFIVYDKDGKGIAVKNEGDVQVHINGPYPVSYRAIVPKANECTNLLVPVCLSASHMAYGSIRMEPVFMVLGQSAATAAAMAIDGQTSVQAVPYPKLRERLLADGQNLEWTAATKAAAAATKGAKSPAEGPKKPGVKRVVCFGDSITAGAYPGLLGTMLGENAEVFNAGVGGQNTAQGLTRMQKDVVDRQPDVVVVLFGTNDTRIDSAQAYVPLEKYVKNLQTIVDASRKAGAKVVLMTIPPINEAAYFTRHKKESFEKVGGLEKLLNDYRAAQRKLAEAEKLPVIDLATLLADKPGWQAKDGVHRTDKGAEIIANAVAEAVKPMAAAKD